MINSPPPERPDDRPTDRNSLKFDDFIGVLVAFTTIGTILWWSLSQLGRDRFGGFLNLPADSGERTPRAFEMPPKTGGRAVITPAPGVPSPETEILTEVPPTPRTGVVPVPVPVPSPSPVPVPTASPMGFSDVPANYWAAPFIAVVVRRNILGGFPDGTFGPDKVVTRSEFAKLVRDAFNASKTRGSVEFKDLPSGDQRERAIDEAVETEFMKGYPGQVFRPGEPIKRVEALVALTNGLKLPPAANTDTLPATYKDSGEIPKYAREAVATATKAGLVANYPDTGILAPNRGLTRAEASAFIHQALVSSGAVDKISSPYIVGAP